LFSTYHLVRIQGLDVGVGVGVCVGEGVGVCVKLGRQSKHAPFTLEPTSKVNVMSSTPLIFSNKPS
jgi:hypothetical protein